MGKKWKQRQTFFSWVPKSLRTVTAAMKLKTLFERKAIRNLDSELKSRDITLPTKFHLVKTMVFPVIMYVCESGTIKKAECQRIDAFELWCWRLLRVPWTTRSNQSILKEFNPEYSLEGLMLKLKLQYFGQLMGRTSSLKKTLILRKTEGRRRRGWQRMRWGDDKGWDGWMTSPTQWTWAWASSRNGDGQGSLACCSPWDHKKLDKTEQLKNNNSHHSGIE